MLHRCPIINTVNKWYSSTEASDFTEKTFYGPIWKQIRDALDYIKTTVIEEKVVKVDGRAKERTLSSSINELLLSLIKSSRYPLRICSIDDNCD